jgi:hypothetical protein
MCCMGKAHLNCPFHLLIVLSMIVVALILVGHILMDAISVPVASLASLHLHTSYPPPTATVANAFWPWVFLISAPQFDLVGWTEPPTTPPPLPSA